MAALAARPGREGELHQAMQMLARRDALAISRRFSGLKRRISGYALDRLLPENGYDVARFLCGTEGTLATTLRAGIPVVGLEPSCTAVFRHEAVDLLPGDERAERAKKLTHTLAELLAAYAPDWRPPAVGTKALVQRHCHQNSVMGFEADSALMRAAGIDAVVPDSGCCGLAGNFGFEKGHYEVSQAAGERVLLPAVRAADPTTAIVADGFSCRT
jgi:Fe-S oxidoreductase